MSLPSLASLQLPSRAQAAVQKHHHQQHQQQPQTPTSAPVHSPAFGLGGLNIDRDDHSSGTVIGRPRASSFTLPSPSSAVGPRDRAGSFSSQQLQHLQHIAPAESHHESDQRPMGFLKKRGPGAMGVGAADQHQRVTMISTNVAHSSQRQPLPMSAPVAHPSSSDSRRRSSMSQLLKPQSLVSPPLTPPHILPSQTPNNTASLSSSPRTTSNATITAAPASSTSTSVPAVAPAPAPTEGKRINYPPHIRQILLSWLEAHRSNPYPTEIDKNQLSTQTGLTLQQVNNWFINARRRRYQYSSDMSLHISTTPTSASPSTSFPTSTPTPSAATTAGRKRRDSLIIPSPVTHAAWSGPMTAPVHGGQGETFKRMRMEMRPPPPTSIQQHQHQHQHQASYFPTSASAMHYTPTNESPRIVNPSPRSGNVDTVSSSLEVKAEAAADVVMGGIESLLIAAEEVKKSMSISSILA